MLTAFIKKRHDNVNTVSLTGSCGDDSLKILEMVVRRHMVYMTADSVSRAVVGNVYHNVKVCTADRFLNDSLALTSTKTGALTVYKERLLTVALGNVVQTFFFYQFLTEFYQFSVNLLCKIAAAFQRCDTDWCDRHRFLEQFYVRHDIPPK